MRAKAILFTAPNQVALGEAEIPEPGNGEVIVEALYTCVSPGTELRSLAGLQDGLEGWPFIPGYSMVGTVRRQGPGATLPVGTPVFCRGTQRADRYRLWGGHVSHAVAAESQLFPLPDGLDPLDAAPAKLAAIAYHGLCLTNPLPHETVAVVGLGPIGQLAARVHALTGARVVAADRSPARVEVARRAGVEAFVPAGPLGEEFRALLPAGADVVVDATGVAAAAADVVSVARDMPWDRPVGSGARYLVQGSYPGEVSFPYQHVFRKELAILLTRDEQPRDMLAVLDLIRRGRLATRDLIGAVVPPEQAPEIYPRLQAAGDLLTAAFRWS